MNCLLGIAQTIDETGRQPQVGWSYSMIPSAKQ
jgi:hypothetical protein